MFGSEVLDVAAAIIFVFLLVSILASAIREGIEGFLKTRSVHLEAGLKELLQDQEGTGLTTQLYNHPLIFSLYAGNYPPTPASWLRWLPKKWPKYLSLGRNLPTYIPSRNFALALMDLAARGPVSATDGDAAVSAPITLQALRANLSVLENVRVQRALLTAIDTAQGDLQKAQTNIEAWYDSTMDRVSGWYKRSTQGILFGIGLAIAIALNVNTITIGNYLYRDRTARETLVARAQAATANPNYPGRTYPEIQTELNTLNLPIGGNNRWADLKDNTKRIPTLGGWLLTAIACSFGAPFWFDLLNKIMVIRSTVKPHQKSPEEASEDHQDPKPPTPPAPAPATPGTAQPPAATPPPADLQNADEDADDGCGLEITTPTNDEDLPLTEGGVS
ncbi:cell division septation protein DedD [Granulicella aggregans]|uniref:Cell division septation protein DedD n=1 Tax=Granulicella aggregans TaxID=474949 RepID=A0A7W7ZCF8_9BACT|nr:hypothetical protein [Granulicella aggregans]MBB5057370.1 cell division septation protein DedD [Granulicella aggregans]